MHLTLFVPDLHWPDVGNRAAYDFSGADDLARVLAAADLTQSPLSRFDSWERQLARAFGITDAHPPLAALRALGQELAITGPLLCADPVNLDFVQQALVLSPVTAASLSDADTLALIESLNTEFTDEGRFVTGRKHEAPDGEALWYFEPKSNETHGQAPLPDLAATSRWAGRRVDADETRQHLGSDGLQWLNRIQMCLNQHPVNLAREASGLPVVNSLWPWGPGAMTHKPATRFTHAVGSLPLLRGLCQASHTALQPAADFSALNGKPLVTDMRLAQAVSRDDLTAWQTALSGFVTDWISPSLRALTDKDHMLQSLTLISPNTQQESVWMLNRTSPALRGNLLQRWLKRAPKAPSLQTLLGSWSA